MTRIQSIYSDQYASLQDKNERFSKLWVGRVIRVNEDDETFDVDWQTFNGVHAAATYSYAYSGPRGMLGGIPEKNSFVVAGWTWFTPTGNCIPIILGFLPRIPEFAKQFKIPYDTDTYGERTKTRYARPRLRQGDQAIISAAQSGVLANNDLKLFSGGLGEMFFRSSDTALLQRFLSESHFTAAGRHLVGLVERPDSSAPAVETDEGVVRRYPLASSISLLDGGPVWVEDRLEMPETSDGSIPLMEGEYGVSRDTYTVALRRVFGTLVGNDPSQEALYGYPLVRDVCADGQLNLAYTAASDQEAGQSSVSAFHFSMPGYGEVASVDIDKYGRLAVLLGTNPDKDYRSLELAAVGKVSVLSGSDWTQSIGGNLSLSAEEDVSIRSETKLLLASGDAAYLSGSRVYLGRETAPDETTVSGRGLFGP